MTGRQESPRLAGHAFKEHRYLMTRVVHYACECGTDLGSSRDYSRREAKVRHKRHKERFR